jgi:uncharacterized protein (TIGR00369 family)
VSDGTILEQIAAARAQGDLTPLLDAIPYAKFMGFSVRVEDGALVTSMAYSPHLVGNPAIPALHGGTLGALMESAAAFTVLWAAETVLLPKTITLTIDYLKPAKPVTTHARGVLTRNTRRVASVRVEAYQDDPAVPVASAHVHFLVKRD